VKYIGECIRENRSLSLLNLSYNKITDGGASLLLNVLAQNSIIVSLDLTGNNIKKQSTLKEIDKILLKNSKLIGSRNPQPQKPLTINHPGPPPHLDQRIFKTSHYKLHYNLYKPPENIQQIFTALHSIIQSFCTQKQISSFEGETFFSTLKTETLDRIQSPYQISSLCMYLWTMATKLRSRELCSIINEILRTDNPSLMEPLCTLTRGINTLCVAGRKDSDTIQWPQNFTLYRGGGLPEEHRSFFYP